MAFKIFYRFWLTWIKEELLIECPSNARKCNYVLNFQASSVSNWQWYDFTCTLARHAVCKIKGNYRYINCVYTLKNINKKDFFSSKSIFLKHLFIWIIKKHKVITNNGKIWAKDWYKLLNSRKIGCLILTY